MSKNVFSGMMPALYCGSMGDWPLLTDEQRMTGVEGLVKAGLRVIVGTGHKTPCVQPPWRPMPTKWGPLV